MEEPRTYSKEDLKAIEYHLQPLINAIQAKAEPHDLSIDYAMLGPSNGMMYPTAVLYNFPDRQLSLVYVDDVEEEHYIVYELMAGEGMYHMETTPIPLSDLIFPEDMAQRLIEKALCLDDSCPGCGCKPGDGKTEGCRHPNGCGKEMLFIGEFALDELGGGDDFTSYAIVGGVKVQVYVYMDGRWEIHDFNLQTNDEPESATLRGSSASKDWALESAIYYYRNREK